LRTDGFEYDVFLSYRHKPLDKRICKRLHTLLETYKPPRRFKQARINRVFRDDDELPAAGILSDTIGYALKSAECLVVICSPDTPESQWVDREVRTFIELGRSDKIFALLIKGTPEESFPQSLKRVRGIENRTLSVEAKTEKKGIKAIKRHIIRVIAEATDVPFDRLRLSHRRRAVRRTILSAAALAVFLTVSGFYSLYQWTRASYFNLTAKIEGILITEVVNSLTFDLPKAVGNIPGTKPVITEILNENLTYLDRIMALDGNNPETLMDKAANYLSLASAWISMADFDKAVDYAREAVQIFDNPVLNKLNTGQRERRVILLGAAGLVIQTAGKSDEALPILRESLETARNLVQADGTASHRRDLAEAYMRMGTCSLYLPEKDKADKYYRNALELYEALYQESALNLDALCKVYEEIGNAYRDAGYSQAAASYTAMSLEALEEASELDPSLKADLVRAYIQSGISAMGQAQSDEAVAAFNQALGLYPELPEDQATDALLADIYGRLAAAWQLGGDLARADDYYHKCLEVWEKYYDRKEDLSAQRELGLIYQRIGDNYARMSRYEESLTYYQKSIDTLIYLAQEKGELAAAVDLGASYNDMGTVYMSMNRHDDALSAFLEAAACFSVIDEVINSNLIKSNLITSYTNAAISFRSRGLNEGAKPYYLKASEVCDALGKSATLPDEQRLMADTYNSTGICLMDLYAFEEASDYHEKCLSLYEKLYTEEPAAEYQRGYALSLYAKAINSLGLDSRNEAEYLYKLALNAMDVYVNDGGESFRSTYYGIYALYYFLFRPEESARALEVGLMALEEGPQSGFVRQVYSYGLLFTGDYKGALEELSGLKTNDPALLQSVAFDFYLFRKNGLPQDVMDRMLKDLSQSD
jgi:tetratricopeptide (TPR) repeat protein